MQYENCLFTDERCLLLGKAFANENGGLVLNWSDGGFSVNFYGTGCILHFDAFTGENVAYIRVWVDGKAQRFAISTGREKVIIEDLEEADHILRVLYVTEEQAPLTIAGLTLCGNQPTLLDRPIERPLRLLFIGDSISCGYGVMAPPTSGSYASFEQDSSRSYAYYAADLLNAEVLLSGSSGRGVVCNCDGDRNIMNLRQAFQWQTREGGQWDHSRFVPHLTVINAGTNDSWGGATNEEFIEGAKDLMHQIRAAYPVQPILWCYGVLDQQKILTVQQAVEEFDQEEGNAYFLPVEAAGRIPGEIGGGGHSNYASSIRVGTLLAEKIKSILHL